MRRISGIPGNKAVVILPGIILFCILSGLLGARGEQSLGSAFSESVRKQTRHGMAGFMIPVLAYDVETQTHLWDNGGMLLWFTGMMTAVGYAEENASVPIFAEDDELLSILREHEEEETIPDLDAATLIAGEQELIQPAQIGANPDGWMSFEDVVKPDLVPDRLDSQSYFLDNGQKQILYSMENLRDADYLMEEFYVIDSSTSLVGRNMSTENLLGTDVSVKKEGEGPHILIYHTHSQEAFADSNPSDPNTTIVGAGEYLTRLLTERYGFSVLHHTGQYDVLDRDRAYSYSGPALQKILEENPGIDVVIDLHRDGVNQSRHLVTEINGRKMAQFMFFNGLSYTDSIGHIDYLPNPYIDVNMAFSFQMQKASNEFYPGLARKIYLKGYRYNMHYCPKTLLIELGAQTNTIEEVKNACEPLAAILAYVLDGKNREE